MVEVCDRSTCWAIRIFPFPKSSILTILVSPIVIVPDTGGVEVGVLVGVLVGVELGPGAVGVGVLATP